jgi:hypothetical protein
MPTVWDKPILSARMERLMAVPGLREQLEKIGKPAAPHYRLGNCLGAGLCIGGEEGGTGAMKLMGEFFLAVIPYALASSAPDLYDLTDEQCRELAARATASAAAYIRDGRESDIFLDFAGNTDADRPIIPAFDAGTQKYFISCAKPGNSFSEQLATKEGQKEFRGRLKIAVRKIIVKVAPSAKLAGLEPLIRSLGAAVLRDPAAGATPDAGATPTGPAAQGGKIAWDKPIVSKRMARVLADPGIREELNKIGEPKTGHIRLANAIGAGFLGAGGSNPEFTILGEFAQATLSHALAYVWPNQFELTDDECAEMAKRLTLLAETLIKDGQELDSIRDYLFPKGDAKDIEAGDLAAERNRFTAGIDDYLKKIKNERLPDYNLNFKESRLRFRKASQDLAKVFQKVAKLAGLEGILKAN